MARNPLLWVGIIADPGRCLTKTVVRPDAAAAAGGSMRRVALDAGESHD